MKSHRIISNHFILLAAILLSWAMSVSAQESETSIKDIYAEDSTGELEYYEMEFEMLETTLNVNVDVASLFPEDDLVVGSSVSEINPDTWKKLGARRMHEALNDELSVMTYNYIAGTPAVAIRGYASPNSHNGVAVLLDGVPLTDLSLGSASTAVPAWELGTLSKIEMIKGPGSAIYGSDAFHGVISLKTFESDEDYYFIEGAGSYPAYYNSSFQISQGIADNFIRIDMSGGVSGKKGPEMDYEYISFDSPDGTAARTPEYDSKSGVLKLSVNPIKKLKIKTGLYANQWTSGNYPSPYGIYLKNYDNMSGDFKFLMGNGSIDYTFENKISIMMSGYLWERDQEFETPYAVVNQDADPMVYLIQPGDYHGILQHVDNRSGATLTIKQPENKFNLQWLIAYSYTKMEVSSTKYKLKTVSTGSIIDVGNGKQAFDGLTRDINSFYCQLKYGIIKDRLFILFGGRYDDYSYFGGQTTPRGGLIFLPTKNSSLKAIYGRAFRAPSGSEQTDLSGVVLGSFDIKPEIIDVYELIYLHQSKNWKLNITGFYSYWKEGITSYKIDVPIGTYMSVYTNGGKNRAYGGESTFNYILKPFAFDLGFSYVYSEALDAEDYNDPTKIVDMKYNLFPEYSIISGILYIFKPLNINIYINNRVYLKMSTFDFESISESKETPYWRTDMNISKMIIDKLEIALDIRNLFNRDNSIPSILGNPYPDHEPGISAMLRAGYKF